MQKQIHWDGKKGLEHALLCEACKKKIYGVYAEKAGLKVCYLCAEGKKGE